MSRSYPSDLMNEAKRRYPHATSIEFTFENVTSCDWMRVVATGIEYQTNGCNSACQLSISQSGRLLQQVTGTSPDEVYKALTALPQDIQ